MSETRMTKKMPTLPQGDLMVEKADEVVVPTDSVVDVVEPEV